MPAHGIQTNYNVIKPQLILFCSEPIIFDKARPILIEKTNGNSIDYFQALCIGIPIETAWSYILASTVQASSQIGLALSKVIDSTQNKIYCGLISLQLMRIPFAGFKRCFYSVLGS